MNNWKTTTLGILTIVGAIVSAGTSLFVAYGLFEVLKFAVVLILKH